MIYLKSDHLYNEKNWVWFGGELGLQGWLCRDLEMEMEMEMVVVIELVSARSRIETEVGIKKKGSFLVSIDNIATYLRVARFCISDNKMSIPNTLLSHLTIAPRLSQICHTLQHFLWPFLSRSTALEFTQNVLFAVVQLSHQWTAYVLVQAFISPRPTTSESSLFSPDPFIVNSRLFHQPHIQPIRNTTMLPNAFSSSNTPKTTININASSNYQYMQNQETSGLVYSHLVHQPYIQPMENTTMLPNAFSSSNTPKTTININASSNFQDMQNQERSGLVYAQNDQLTYSTPSAPFMPLTHLQPTSNYPQLHNQTLHFPYVLLPEHQAQLVWPGSSYQYEGSEMGTAAHNLSPRGLPSGVLSDALARDMPEVACSMQPFGISEFEKQRKLFLATCKAARAKRMMKRRIRSGVHMKSSGGYQEGFNTFGPPDNKVLRLLLQKELTSSDVGSNGRIILPKKDAERSLPNLSSREGIMVVLRDVHSNHEWRMRYGFWQNHKGRIYLLDHFGDFVNQNRFETGDILTLYEDERKELYFSIKKTEKPTPTPTPSNEQSYLYYTYTGTPFSEEGVEEENSSLEMLMEELKHGEQPEANNLTTLYGNSASTVDNRWKDSQTQVDGGYSWKR